MRTITLRTALAVLTLSPPGAIAVPYNPGELPFGWFATVECAVDLPRVFANVIGVETPQNTAFSCTQYCQAHGYTYAGVEAMDWCLCGTDIAIAPTPAPLTDCDLACSGDPNRSCGGPWRIQIYRDFFAASRGLDNVTDEHGAA